MIVKDLHLLFAVALLAIPHLSGAQPVSLHLRPRVGDTLRMAMDQDVEMWGTRKVAGVDSTRSTKTSVRVLTRAIVLKSEYAGTLLSAVAESLSIDSNDEYGSQALDEARRRLIGRAVQLRMAVDGATQLVSSDAGTDPAMGAIFAQMPSTLPSNPVNVGAKWTKEMVVPAAGEQGVLRSTFRLDSLTRAGQFAWISINGMLMPPAGGSAEEFGGTMTGALVVDRKRGWLVEARTVMTMRSVVPQGAPGGEPMYFRMRVRQWVRAVER